MCCLPSRRWHSHRLLACKLSSLLLPAFPIPAKCPITPPPPLSLSFPFLLFRFPVPLHCVLHLLLPTCTAPFHFTRSQTNHTPTLFIVGLPCCILCCSSRASPLCCNSHRRSSPSSRWLPFAPAAFVAASSTWTARAPSVPLFQTTERLHWGSTGAAYGCRVMCSWGTAWGGNVMQSSPLPFPSCCFSIVSVSVRVCTCVCVLMNAYECSNVLDTFCVIFISRAPYAPITPPFFLSFFLSSR